MGSLDFHTIWNLEYSYRNVFQWQIKWESCLKYLFLLIFGRNCDKIQFCEFNEEFSVLGSFERFIGVLIENYSGKLPFWLAPVQVAVATIVSDVDDYAAEVINSLENAGIRCHSDFRNEKISYKVR